MSVTPTTKQIVRNRQDGKCAKCGEPIDVLIARGPYRIDYDHIKPREFGGGDGPDNIQALHKRCHDPKTFGPGGDLATIAKMKRIAGKEAAHAEAMASGRRRPNAWERRLAAMRGERG